jgi:hypothetical protein
MHPAFTLLELILVIFILSLFIYLGSDLLLKAPSRNKTLTPQTLRSIINENAQTGEIGTLLCTDACTKCYFSPSIHTPFRKLDIPVRLGRQPEVYRFYGSIDPKREEYGRFNGEPVCLMMHVYENGSITPIVLKTEKKVYVVPSFLGDTRTFSTMEEVKNRYTSVVDRLFRGDYY